MVQGYAAKTKVAPDKTRDDIIRLLRRHGATKVAPLSDYTTGQEMLLVELPTRQLKFEIRMPLPGDDEVVYYEYRPGELRRRGKEQLAAVLEQMTRTKWRKMFFYIKAKLDAVQDGTATIEEEFLAQTLMPDGRTVGEWARVQMDNVIESGQMPPLLPGAR